MTTIGMSPVLIEVEVDIARGMPAFTVVGLPDTAVQESRERVRSALKNSDIRFPPTRITVNLAPADIKKGGPIFDFPIAIGILLSSEQIPLREDLLKDSLFIGELALNGNLRHVSGVLSIVSEAKKRGFRRIFLPSENASEAALVDEILIYPVANIKEILLHFYEEEELQPKKPLSEDEIFDQIEHHEIEVDFSAIQGQETAKRALEISAAGSHNLLMCGSPGSGKTLMAKAFASILPRLTRKEAFEVSSIYSIANMLPANMPLMTRRPFRSVHHTASNVSLVGGGKNPSPGEISLAHRGVLFLDEMAEFPPTVLEVLRQPLEDRKITVSRASGSYEFPAHFSLIGATNPCPCGYYRVPNSEKECVCSSTQVSRYQKRLSGPLLDRIDLYIDVSPVKFEKLISKEKSENSESILKRVQKARDIQQKRFFNHVKKICSNSEMNVVDVKEFCEITKQTEDLLRSAMRQFSLSARSYHRILKVARSIADLCESENISIEHVAEALQYRPKFSENDSF